MDVITVSYAPIPVGHRVRITWHVHEEPGLGGGEPRRDTRPHQPWITDLDTGIEYRTDWAVGASRRRHPDEPYTLGDALIAGFSEGRVVEGVVRACVVTTVRGYPELDLQTRLTLDVDD